MTIGQNLVVAIANMRQKTLVAETVKSAVAARVRAAYVLVMTYIKYKKCSDRNQYINMTNALL